MVLNMAEYDPTALNQFRDALVQAKNEPLDNQKLYRLINNLLSHRYTEIMSRENYNALCNAPALLNQPQLISKIQASLLVFLPTLRLFGNDLIEKIQSDETSIEDILQFVNEFNDQHNIPKVNKADDLPDYLWKKGIAPSGELLDNLAERIYQKAESHLANLSQDNEQTIKVEKRTFQANDPMRQQQFDNPIRLHSTKRFWQQHKRIQKPTGLPIEGRDIPEHDAFSISIRNALNQTRAFLSKQDMDEVYDRETQKKYFVIHDDMAEKAENLCRTIEKRLYQQENNQQYDNEYFVKQLKNLAVYINHVDYHHSNPNDKFWHDLYSQFAEAKFTMNLTDIIENFRSIPHFKDSFSKYPDVTQDDLQALKEELLNCFKELSLDTNNAAVDSRGYSKLEDIAFNIELFLTQTIDKHDKLSNYSQDASSPYKTKLDEEQEKVAFDAEKTGIVNLINSTVENVQALKQSTPQVAIESTNSAVKEKNSEAKQQPTQVPQAQTPLPKPPKRPLPAIPIKQLNHPPPPSSPAPVLPAQRPQAQAPSGYQLDTDINLKVKQRGNQFIKGAELIFENSPGKSAGLDEIKKYWDSKQSPTQEDLLALERLLIDDINQCLYNNEKNFSQVKDELDNAENHTNWQARKEHHITQENINRTEQPISQFSKKQESEYLTIITSKRSTLTGAPGWFTALPAWEKSYLQSKVVDWQKQLQEPNGVKNLGDYLGPLSSTVRRYPGAANTYHTQVEITGEKGNISFEKIRTSVLSPTKMKAKSKAQKQRKEEITTQNLEQMVAAAIKIKLQQPDCTRPLDCPILLQTLFSPPLQPPGQHNNEALQKAVNNVREVLSNDEALKSFCLNNEINPNALKAGKITLLYSNTPVNKARGISWLINKFTTMGQENNATAEALNHQVLAIQGTKDTLAYNALQQYLKTDVTSNTITSLKTSDYNLMAEKAALEQIIVNQLGGIRVGSCVSGKDREEMVTQIAIAQCQFFAKHGHFPPLPTDKDELKQAERADFEEMVAKQFLSGYGQRLAEENAKGCSGLKNVEDVFGKRICEKIRLQAVANGLVSEKDPHPVTIVQRIAGLNKLSTKKIQKIAKSELFQNIKAKLFRQPSQVQPNQRERKTLLHQMKQSSNPPQAQQKENMSPNKAVKITQQVDNNKNDKPKNNSKKNKL